MLYADASASLEDMREAVSTLDELQRTARRVFGGAHPVTRGLEVNLRKSRDALAARESGAS